MLTDATIELGDGIGVRTAVVDHPLLGPAQAIVRGDQEITHLSAIDWAAPARIPAVAAPARLPPGSGAVMMNELARRALAAGVQTLRYAGPYPTPALWRALARSFRARGGDEAAFTADLLGRAARLARDEIAIDFVPAPHARVTWPGGWSEVRDGVERVVVAGVGYAPGGSPARLVDGAAELWFGDAIYARVAQVDAAGALVGAVTPPPPLTSRVIGQAFPPPLCAAIAELVAELVPAPIASAAAARVTSATIRWADLGAQVARVDDAGFALHAALWERLAPHGLPRVALAIAEALAPVVVGAVVADLARVTLVA